MSHEFSPNAGRGDGGRLSRYGSTFSIDAFDGRSGWLEKRVVESGCMGRKVSWKKKWFLLSGTALTYYNEPEVFSLIVNLL